MINNNSFCSIANITKLKQEPIEISLKDNKWKLLKQGLKEESIIKFLEEFHYQISSKYFTKEVNNLQNKIKKDLINLLHINLSEYMNEICFNYNNASTNNYFNKKEIEQIFMNENLETFYETQIKDSLCKYAQTQNTIKDAHVYGNVLTVMEIGLNLQKKNWT